jgi:hypothetical protein
LQTFPKAADPTADLKGGEHIIGDVPEAGMA